MAGPATDGQLRLGGQRGATAVQGGPNDRGALQAGTGTAVPSGPRVLIWGVAHMPVPQVRALLLRALGSRRARWLVTIKRVRQRNGVWRHDAYVTAGHVAKTVELLARVSRRVGWRVAQHRPYWERSRVHNSTGHGTSDSSSGANSGQGSVASGHNNDQGHGRWRVATWNVCGIKGKREAVKHMAWTERLDVLALQETLRPQSWWRLSLGPGWTCLEAPYSSARQGERGVALAAGPAVTMVDVGISDPNCIFARITRAGVQGEVVVGSVYCPWAGRTAAMARLQGHLQQVMRKFAHLPVLIMGDWNMSVEQVSSKLTRWGVGLVPCGVSGSRKTFWRGNNEATWTAIDHIAVNPAARAMITGARVLRGYDDSDHFPLRASLALHSPVLPPVRPPKIMQRPVLRERERKVAMFNRFEALAVDLEEDEEDEEGDEGEPAARLDGQAEAFTAACWQAAEAVGGTKVPGTKAPSFRLSKRAKRRIAARQQAWKAWLDCDGGDEGAVAIAHEAYLEARGAAQIEVRRARVASWVKHVKTGASEFAAHGGSASFWQWAKGLYDPRPAATVTTPVRGDNGALILEPEGILQAWADHYARLAADETGHSRDEGYWEAKAREWGLADAPLPAAVREELNQPVEWGEVAEVLRAGLKLRTAAGGDGVVPELFRAALSGNDADGAPPNKLARALLALMQRVLASGRIPVCWQTANVVSIPKKGDLTQRDNYRGISLIPVALKLTTSVAIRRVYTALVEAGKLRKEQAGFRNLEECMGQVVALHEIVARRRAVDKPTYVCFVDLRKAFDTVPHEALLLKMKLHGIEGSCLAFFRQLYMTSRIRVRLPCGLSPEVQLLRGVRQGCPASPTLFNLFINDCLEGMEGVEVPGVPGQRCPGLMFADDLVLLAESPEALQVALDKLTVWVDRWEMLAAQSKCGVMCLGTESQEALKQLAAHRPFMLQRAAVPVVDSYTYLGIEITPSMSLGDVVEARRKAGLRGLHALRPFLLSRSVPVVLRLHVYRAVQFPRLLYGCELFGMHQDRVAPLQRMANIGMNWIMGNRGEQHSFAWRVLSAEAGVPTVEDHASLMRARAWAKYPYLNTWSAVLRQHPVPTAFWRRKGRTWMMATQVWVSQRDRTLVRFEAEGSRTEAVAKAMGPDSYLRARIEVRTKAKLVSSMAGQAYEAAQYALTRNYLKISSRHAYATSGIQWLLAARTGRILWAPRLQAMGLLRPGWQPQCPMCEGGPGSDCLTHLMLRCPALGHARESTGLMRLIFIVEGIVRGVEMPEAELDGARTILLLGGQIGGPERVCMRTWLGPQRRRARRVAHDPGEPVAFDGVQLNTPPFVRVALFLRIALPCRAIALQRRLCLLNRRPDG